MRSWTLLIAAISMLAVTPPRAWAEGEITPPPETGPVIAVAPEASNPAPMLDDPLLAAPAAAPSAPDSPDSSGSSEPSEVAPQAAQTPELDASMAAATAGVPARSGRAAAIVIGPMGTDAHGHEGRVHTVARGDTLWDIAAAYLGTAWVWPSIWDENDAIQNPHRISPGDRVWISSTEIRIVSEGEADQILASEPVAPAAPAPVEEVPAEVGEGEEDPMAAETATALEQLPVAMPIANAGSSETGRTIDVSMREGMGFVTGETLEAAASVVDSPEPRTWLAEGDSFYLGLGEGNVRVGDRFTVFRDYDAVRDTDSRTLLGYHVHVLGWAEVTEVRAETSIAVVRMSRGEMHRGDRLIPRAEVHTNVPVKESPDGIEGRIVYMPDSRTEMAGGDYLYINRGTLHGFEVGSELEVYEAGRLSKEKERGTKVMTPDHKVAELVIVEVQPDSAVAFVVEARRELSVGDRVRPAVRRLASR